MSIAITQSPKLSRFREYKPEFPEVIQRSFAQKFGSLELLAEGSDSSVFFVQKTGKILKVYRSLKEKVSPDRALQIIRSYVEDTKKAIELTGKEALYSDYNEGRFNGKYKTGFVIYPQGEDIGIHEGYVYSHGQNLISGEILDDFINEQNRTVEVHNGNGEVVPFYLSKGSFHNVETLTDYFVWEKINQKLGTHFWICGINIKPKIDPVNNIVYLHVNDLGNNLYTHYVENKIM